MRGFFGFFRFRISDSLLSFVSGWKQYEVQGRRLFWNPETMRMQTKARARARDRKHVSGRFD